MIKRLNSNFQQRHFSRKYSHTTSFGFRRFGSVNFSGNKAIYLGKTSGYKSIYLYKTDSWSYLKGE